MRFLLDGAGRRALAAAFDLLRESDLESLVIVPASESEAAEARRRLTDERIRLAAPRDSIASHLEGSGVLLSGASPEPETVAIAIRKGWHVVAGARSGVSLRELVAFDRDAAAMRVTVLPAMGLAPGLVNVLAADLVERFDRCDAVRIRVGGLPVRPVGALGIAASMPVDDLLEDYAHDVELLRHGQLARLAALSEIHTVDLPPPFGKAESALTAAGLSLMPEIYSGKLETLEYRTVRHPGHFEKIRFLSELGLLGGDEWDLAPGVRLAPRTVVREAIRRASTYPDVADFVIVRLTAEGWIDDEPIRISVECLDFGEPAVGVSAVERMVAYPLAAAARMVARGDMERRGAFPPERSIRWEDLRRDLEGRGISFTERQEVLARATEERRAHDRSGSSSHHS